jgi:hypothetical protein
VTGEEVARALMSCQMDQRSWAVVQLVVEAPSHVLPLCCR